MQALINVDLMELLNSFITPFGEEEIEIEATLMATSIDEKDMDLLIKQLNQNARVRQAFWSPRTND